MSIRLVTFGGLRAADEAGELEWLGSQHSRAALFTYLAVERRVSRESLTALFWPESDADKASHALRQSLYHLRKALGSASWVEVRANELLVTDEVRSDAQTFTESLERGDLESAVRLYRGPFLDGVHLVDLKPWESWVDGRRTQYARAFRKACRELIEAKRATGDLAGAIVVAESWTACDAWDDEAQHRLIEALADAGERAEAIRQYDTFVRRLETEGLRPLDDTVALVERIRSQTAPLPVLREPAVAPRSPAPEAESATLRRPPRSPWLVPALVAMIVLVAAVWLVRRTRVQPAAAPSSTAVVVLPFSVRGADAVHYLGEGMVNLLGAALDGAGTLRPVDTRATFAAVGEVRGVNSVARANRIAKRLGAGMFVLGDVVEAGGRLHIEAAIHGVGADCDDASGPDCSSAAPDARAVVSGAADSVFHLVDRLAALLLGRLGDPAADRLLRTASVTTSSLPAFKAYLQGESLMRDGLFERAADAYAAATALDSTFAVAHYRLALAREWAPLPGNEDAASAAGRHGARLSARDRSLLSAFRAWRAGDATAADHAYRAILARYPDDVDAWFQLGEIQFHHGPLTGRPLHQSEEAWRKVLSYEPRNLFALTHLARIAAADGRTAALDSLLGQFSQELLRDDRRLAELVILRALAKGDAVAAHSLTEQLRRGESFSVWRIAAFLTAFSPDPLRTRAVIEQLAGNEPNAGMHADLLWFVSALDLAAGRRAAAQDDMARAVEAERSAARARRRPAFKAVTEWFAATLPLPYADTTLTRMRREAASASRLPTDSSPAFVNELGVGTPIQLEPLRQYTLGMLSSRLDDTGAATAAAAGLERLAASDNATTLVRDLDRGLRARLAFENGSPEEALALLEQLENQDLQGDVAVIPFAARANERFLHAEVLAALGRNTEALQWFESLGNGSVSEIPLEALARFRQAGIQEHLGNREEAADLYERFLTLWREADAEFQPLVQIARQRLADVEPNG